ncbi:hypothetical protein ACFX2J_035854 [Malus domestica]
MEAQRQSACIVEFLLPFNPVQTLDRERQANNLEQRATPSSINDSRDNKVVPQSKEDDAGKEPDARASKP